MFLAYRPSIGARPWGVKTRRMGNWRGDVDRPPELPPIGTHLSIPPLPGSVSGRLNPQLFWQSARA